MTTTHSKVKFNVLKFMKMKLAYGHWPESWALASQNVSFKSNKCHIAKLNPAKSQQQLGSAGLISVLHCIANSKGKKRKRHY